MGGRNEPDPNNDDAGDVAAIRRAIEAGVRHIDTAELYANGRAEELVGEAARPYDRLSLFIASKVRETKLGYDAVLYYVHKPNPAIPAEETAAAFNELLKRGMIKNVGISNATVETTEKFASFLDSPIFAVQCHYNLIVREPVLKGVLEYCRRKKIHFIAWRPVQLPSEKLSIRSLAERGAYPLLDQIADKYGMTPAQTAVRWLTQQENVGIVFKTKNPEHLKEIIDAQNVTLSDEDTEALTRDFPRMEAEGFTTGGKAPLI